tara:strand:- start:335 stop:466 length:132 start_codon:yes stop_codon:yes gene_type:complete
MNSNQPKLNYYKHLKGQEVGVNKETEMDLARFKILLAVTITIF